MKPILIIGIVIFILVGCNNEKQAASDYSIYNVEMEFDTTQLKMHCKMKIRWFNNSSAPVSKIPFKFKIDESNYVTGKATINNEDANILYTSKSIDGFDGFLVESKEIIRKNQSSTIEFNFELKRNRYFNRKLFYKNLPLISYFDDGKFNHAYQVHSEFHVTITIPSEYEVATTGLTVNQKRESGLITIQTKAKSVPSYGVILFKDAIVEEAKAGNVLIRSFYFEKDEKWGKRFLDYSQDIITFYEDTLGFYPQPVLNIIPGMADKPYGGWPISPNLVGIHRGIDKLKEKAETHGQWIMAHEIAHQYWGYNYVLEPLDYPHWFGISMGIYTDRMYLNNNSIYKDYNSEFFGRYITGVQKGYNTTIMQTTDSLNSQGFDWNNIITHGKSWTVVNLLEYELGADVFIQILKNSLENYKGVNVTLEMFKSDCERISGRNLDDFFQIWFYSNSHMEYATKDVIIEKRDSTYHSLVRINKLGKGEISNIEMELHLTNNDTIRAIFDGTKSEVSMEFQSSSPVQKIVLDPKNRLPLIDRKDWVITSANKTYE